MNNFYEVEDVKKHIDEIPNPNYHLHNFNVPFRCLVNAPSGSGKSNFVTNLISLFSKGKGTFDDIYIICKSRDEPLYKFLEEKGKGKIRVEEDLKELPPINEFKPYQPSLLIFDDMITDTRAFPKIEEAFIRGRKRGCSMLFLTQSYYATPKIIRQNINYLVILKIGGLKDINAILRECAVDVDKELLLKMYNISTKKKLDCFIINLDKSGNERYRHNFLKYFRIE